MDIYIARQPIFDSSKKLFAYELLFRSDDSNSFPVVNGETATSSLLVSSFFTIGLDRISGGKKVFINFTSQLLRQRTAEMFPADEIIVEILEDVEPTHEILTACENLVDKGYTLALDDFIYHQNLKPLIKLASIIKIDFRLVSSTHIREMVKDLGKCNCKLLAEKIETYQEFKQAVELGFDYFQGYFFAKPEVLKNKDIPASNITVMKLVCEVNRKEQDIGALEKLILEDVSLSFKLMNFLNSSYFNRSAPLTSVRHAIVSLGVDGIRTFVSLIAAGELAAGKPQELIKTSIIRAHFLEQIGNRLNKDGRDMFMLGLFSLLDAMLDIDMSTILEKIPLADEVRTALVSREGELAQYLELVEKYESCQWACVDTQLAANGISAEHILGFYIDSLKIADGY